MANSMGDLALLWNPDWATDRKRHILYELPKPAMDDDDGLGEKGSDSEVLEAGAMNCSHSLSHAI